MTASTPIPRTIVLINIALVLLWLPMIYGARMLVEGAIAISPSADLLQATYLAVVGTAVIVTSSYVFGLVLFNKFMTQNLGGVQPRLIKPLVIGALVLYAAFGVVMFVTL